MSDQDQPRTCNIGFNGLPGSCDLPYGHQGEHRLSGWSPETLDTMPPIYAPDGDAMSDQPLRQAVIAAGQKAETFFVGHGYVAAARTALERVKVEYLKLNDGLDGDLDYVLRQLLAQLTPAGEDK